METTTAGNKLTTTLLENWVEEVCEVIIMHDSAVISCYTAETMPEYGLGGG